MTDFDRDVDPAVFGALNPKEELLWTGHCMSRLGKQKRAESYAPLLRVVPIGLCIVGMFVVIHAITGPEKTGLLAGAGFFLGAAWVAHSLDAGRFHDSKMYCRKQTAYALTDQRAFVLKHCRTGVPMRSAPWRSVDEVRAEGVGSDGRGTVRFWCRDPNTNRWNIVLQFRRVGNANQVAAWAQAAMAKAKG